MLVATCKLAQLGDFFIFQKWGNRVWVTTLGTKLRNYYNFIYRILHISWKFDINFVDVFIDRIALRASKTPLFFKNFWGLRPLAPTWDSAPRACWALHLQTPLFADWAHCTPCKITTLSPVLRTDLRPCRLYIID